MNFRENYQREMNEIEKPADITRQVLNAADMAQETYTDAYRKKNRNILKSGSIWKTAAATIAIACALALCLHHEKVISFAQSVLDRFAVLSVNNEDIEFDEIEPIKINMEGFVRDAKTKIVEDTDKAASRDYFHNFTSYQQMNQLTQLELPCADKVEYREISISITSQAKTGRVNGEILYKGVSYSISGMFKLDGFDAKEWKFGWGFGTEGTKDVYQYGDGKNAYFVKDLDGTDTVYFVEGNILFKMVFNCGDDIELGPTANKKQVKDLLKLFARED